MAFRYMNGDVTGQNAPAYGAVAVTTNDTADLARAPTRSLYIGVSGDVKVDMMNGDTGVTYKAAPVGVLPIRVTRVYLTGTTATNILALYQMPQTGAGDVIPGWAGTAGSILPIRVKRVRSTGTSATLIVALY